MKVKSESEVIQSCPTLSDPMDCSPPGSSVHGIFQARVLEWGAIAFSYIYVYIHTHTHTHIYMGFPGDSDGKKSACNAGGLCSIPGLGRSPGGEHGNPFQYSYLENPRGQRAWRATVHELSKCWT